MKKKDVIILTVSLVVGGVLTIITILFAFVFNEIDRVETAMKKEKIEVIRSKLDSLEQIAVTYYDSSLYDSAMLVCNEMVRLDSTDHYSFLLRSLIKAEMSDSTGAIDDVTKAVDLSPRSSIPYYMRGNYNLKRGDASDALVDFEYAIKFMEDTVLDYFYLRGCAFMETEQFKSALKDFELSADFVNTSESFYHFGLSQYAVSQFDPALVNLRKSIELDSTFSYPYYYRGLSNIELGFIEQGCKDLKMALELGYSEVQQELDAYCL
ncbi:MAG: hypothetical protein RJQ09_06425 [Cyclobacteriaceae bacterium]